MWPEYEDILKGKMNSAAITNPAINLNISKIKQALFTKQNDLKTSTGNSFNTKQCMANSPFK